MFLTLVVVYLSNEVLFAFGVNTICVPVLLPIRVVIIGLLIGYFYITHDRPILFGMLIGSAIYLLIEASVLGCVRDYFNFADLFKFNISDVLITASSLSIALLGLKTSASKFKN